MLKDRSNSDVQYLLGNIPGLTEEALQVMPLPDGVTIEGYRAALVADIIGIARKLVTACQVSGQRRKDFEQTIREGNKAGSWIDSNRNPFPLPVLQLLRDCETQWSLKFILLDCVLTLLPVRPSQLWWEICFSTNTVHRQLRHSPHVRNRQIVNCRRLYSIEHRCALLNTFVKSLKFRSSPRNSL